METKYQDSSNVSFHGVVNSSPQDTMAIIPQTTFSSAFSWMKRFVFRFEFQWSLFRRVQLTISQHLFGQWLGADQATSHYMNQKLTQFTDAYMRQYGGIIYTIYGCIYTYIYIYVHFAMLQWTRCNYGILKGLWKQYVRWTIYINKQKCSVNFNIVPLYKFYI